MAAGGAPPIMLAMLKALRENGYHVELVTGLANRTEKDLLPDIHKGEFKVTVISQLVRNFSPLNDMVAFLKLRRFIKKKGFDIVHTHTTKAGIIGRFAARSAGTPHIFHSTHGHIFEGYLNPVLTKLYISVERMAAGWTHKIITLTHKEIDEYLAWGIGRRECFQCIYNGIEVEQYFKNEFDADAFRERIGIPQAAIVLTTVGRLVPVKGHIFLLEALSAVLAALQEQGDHQLRCLIVGDGELRESLQCKAKGLGLADYVVFLGHQEDVTPYLMVSDVFVLPSLNEGFGLVIAEAMASGLPVVATRVGGVPEIVIDGETGVLIPAKDAKALAEGILTILQDRPRLRQMGEANRKRVREAFSLEKMNHEVELLYKEVLAPK